MNTRNVGHNSLFLDNIMITKPEASSSFLPRLVVCDFGAAVQVTTGTCATFTPFLSFSPFLSLSLTLALLSALPTHYSAENGMKFDKDRRQCGGVLLALFSSTNKDIQNITNKCIQLILFNLFFNNFFNYKYF
jgi:hypothetical protein